MELRSCAGRHMGEMLHSVQNLRVHLLVGLVALLAVGGCTDQPDTEIAESSGPGWRLLGYERDAATSFFAAIVTSDSTLETAWAQGSFSIAQPALDFDTEVGLILTPGVSGSCPDIVFEDLVIEPDDVFAVFDYPSAGQVCTADYNPVSFVFAVERAALSEQFTLAVSETSRCAGCRLDVDLSDEDALEAELWGGPITVEAEGSAPGPGRVNVVRMTADDGQVGAFLFQAAGWDITDHRIRELSSLRFIARIDGFVSSCEGHLCADESCDVADCDGLQPVGEVCTTSPKETLEPQVLQVSFDGDSCAMEALVLEP